MYIKKTDKEIALNRLKSKFKQVCEGNVKIGENTFNSSMESINYLTGILTNYQAGTNTGSFPYRNVENDKISLTETDFKTILHTLQELYSSCFDKMEELVSEIEITSDPLSIDLNAGWPTVPYELQV